MNVILSEMTLRAFTQKKVSNPTPGDYHPELVYQDKLSKPAKKGTTGGKGVLSSNHLIASQLKPM